MEVKEKILEKLKEVIDPEIGLDIVSLGLIEELNIQNKKVFIKLILTTPFCPYLPILTDLISAKLKEEGFESEIEIDFENVWNLDRMSEEAKKKLGII